MGTDTGKTFQDWDQVLKAVVTEISTGGLSVVVDQTRVFIPASLISDVYEKNLEKYKGQEVEFIVTEFNPKKHRIIGKDLPGTDERSRRKCCRSWDGDSGSV